METLKIHNPATGAFLQEVPCTPINEISAHFDRARSAQKEWASLSISKRCAQILILRETILNRIDELSLLISEENGKPRFEAMANEILATVELITYFSKKTKSVLRPESIKMGLMKHRKSYLEYWPLGVVTVISPWNYPFLLPMGEIVMAVLCGNAVIFKPSEVTPLIGKKIQSLFDESGFPKNLVTAVIGDGRLGEEIIKNKPDKIFFTGSVLTGKKIMRQASENLTPVNLELGGKDPMIVLPDADLDYATSAALWGVFSNSGQVCASVERILVHESIKDSFCALLKEKTLKLRRGADLGAITFEKQKSVYSSQIDEAKACGAQFITGGNFSTDRRFLEPTIVTGESIENLSVYKDETFGPVVAISTYTSIDEAIEKANKSNYGLLASVISTNLALAEQVAKKLAAGTVTINEVVYTAGLPETPWGGIKETGFGKKHSDRGLFEFVHTRHIHKPRASFLVFKSWWWYPYSPFQFALFRYFLELYRNSWFLKMKALPVFLWNFLKFIKREPRL